MGRYRLTTLVWVGVVAVAATAATALRLQPSAVTLSEWLACGLVALCAAAANAFPIRSASGGATYRLTSAFVVAGAVIVRPGLLALVPIAALSWGFWRERRRPGSVVRWLFNVAQDVLAAQAASAWVSAIGGPRGT